MGFTVVVPLYNKSQFIQRTLRSVLSQSLQDFEVIVVNDGSTDDGVAMVKALESEKIRMISQDNQGVSVARNRGIKESSFNWVVFLDGDDELEEGYLSSLSECIASDSKCIMYATKYSKVDLKGGLIDVRFKFVPADIGRVKNYYKSCFFGNQIVTSSSVCLNKKMLEFNGYLEAFPCGVKRGEDLDTWVRLSLKDPVFFINKPLVKINSIDSSASNSTYNLSESFEYYNWLSYRAGSLNKKLYIVLLVVRGKLRIMKKLIMRGKFSLILSLFLPSQWRRR